MPSPLRSILNFRDVGQTVNSYLDRKIILPGRLFRSARPDESSLPDRQILRETLGIRTILDLRTTTEHKQQETKWNKSKSTSGTTTPSSPGDTSSTSDDELEQARITIPPRRVEGIRYVDINFNGAAYSRHLVWQLDWYNFFKLVFLMALGRRLEAVSILGFNVMRPRGLPGLAIDSLEVCQAEVKAVFEVLADPAKYPVLVHCTQGKDRTGLVVQLVLMLLMVPVEAIHHDYMLSGVELMPEKQDKLLEVHSIGLTDEFADCDVRLVGLVDTHVRERWGSVEGYLVACGVSVEMLASVKAILSDQGA